MKNNIKRVFLVMLIALGIMFIDSKVYAGYVWNCAYSTDFGNVSIYQTDTYENGIWIEIEYNSNSKQDFEILDSKSFYSSNSKMSDGRYKYVSRLSDSAWKQLYNSNTGSCKDIYFNTELDKKGNNDYTISPYQNNGTTTYSNTVVTTTAPKQTETKTEESKSITVDPVLQKCDSTKKSQIEAQLTQLQKDMETELKNLNSYYFGYTDSNGNAGYGGASTYDWSTYEHLLTGDSADVYSVRVGNILDTYNMKMWNAVKEGGCSVDDIYWTKYENNFKYAAERWSSIIKTNFDKRIEEAVAKGEIGQEQADRYKQGNATRKEEIEEHADHIIQSMSNWYDVLAHGKVLTCTGLLDSELVQIINKVLNWLRILVPILVISLSTVDFGKAVLNEDKDELKQAFTRFVKRLIIAVVIFFVPTIINALVNIINDPSKSIIVDLPDGTKIQTLTDCGIK